MLLPLAASRGCSSYRPHCLLSPYLPHCLSPFFHPCLNVGCIIWRHPHSPFICSLLQYLSSPYHSHHLCLGLHLFSPGFLQTFPNSPWALIYYLLFCCHGDLPKHTSDHNHDLICWDYSWRETVKDFGVLWAQEGGSLPRLIWGWWLLAHSEQSAQEALWYSSFLLWLKPGP